MIHELKCWPNYFTDVLAGKKLFELRRDDRNFQVGDTIRLREWVPPQQRNQTRPSGRPNEKADGCYTGRSIWLNITYVLRPNPATDPDCGLIAGYVALGLELSRSY